MNIHEYFLRGFCLFVLRGGHWESHLLYDAIFTIIGFDEFRISQFPLLFYLIIIILKQQQFIFSTFYPSLKMLLEKKCFDIFFSILSGLLNIFLLPAPHGQVGLVSVTNHKTLDSKLIRYYGQFSNSPFLRTEIYFNFTSIFQGNLY